MRCGVLVLARGLAESDVCTVPRPGPRPLRGPVVHSLHAEHEGTAEDGKPRGAGGRASTWGAEPRDGTKLGCYSMTCTAAGSVADRAATQVTDTPRAEPAGHTGLVQELERVALGTPCGKAGGRGCPDQELGLRPAWL